MASLYNNRLNSHNNEFIMKTDSFKILHTHKDNLNFSMYLVIVLNDILSHFYKEQKIVFTPEIPCYKW